MPYYSRCQFAALGMDPMCDLDAVYEYDDVW
jgi:hypothetical protein